MNHLPVTGSNQLLDLLDPYIPDDCINERWNLRPVRGPRWQFSAAQLWRTHLLALLTPVHSLNLLCTLLSEQRAWRSFARLRHRHEVPDVRILHAFRDRVGVLGLRQINEVLLQPLIPIASLWENATALMDASLAVARAAGAAGAWLGVNQHNARARRFYERSGFAVVGTKHFRVGDRVEDDFVLERAL